MSKALSILTVQQVQRAIFLIRGQRVMLDSDLAAFYGVATSRLNEQLKRNRRRFPKDFAFRLTRKEFANLISQIATSSSGSIENLFSAIRQLMAPRPGKRREIGFHTKA